MKRQTTLTKETNDWATRTSPWAKTIIKLEARHHAMQKDQNIYQIMLFLVWVNFHKTLKLFQVMWFNLSQWEVSEV
jgi:hypothetical protein